MKYVFARIYLVVVLVPCLAFAQNNSQRVRSNTTDDAWDTKVKICQGLPIPEGYMIVAYQPHAACPQGAFVLQKENQRAAASQFPAVKAIASRARKVKDPSTDSIGPNLFGNLQPPTLKAISLDPPLNALITPSSNGTSNTRKEEELSEGDVVRIDTNLVTVPVSVMDRQGRFIGDLMRERFKVFENDVEQKIVHFEPTDKPFTVALVLDTSASTFFHLWEIKEAAIAFAKQLRPQDRVLVVTFDRQVLLLTEATNKLDVVTEAIEQNAVTGDTTRLYDAIDLVITQRLNQIDDRKAIVLFTDGVDTSSYRATYQSTLYDVEEGEILIYPIQYDTRDFPDSAQAPSLTSNSPFSTNSTPQMIYGPRPTQPQVSPVGDYKMGDKYLNQLADKTGGRLYQANNRAQLADAFSKIAAELRSQYSLAYYPQTALQSGERRLIRVKVDQPDVAVRARESYVKRTASKPARN
jgi:Ca-activated chloride channel homolog